MIDLKGKRALVTGGSRGLGAEISKQLADRGCKVAVNYAASKDRAEETVKSLKGDGHVLVQGDVFSRAGVEAVAKEAKEKLGGVDIVISNAGWTKIAPWSDIPVSKAGSIHLVRGLAKSLGPNIRVNAVAPGLILTEWADRFPEEVKENWKEATALKHVPYTEDIAQTYSEYGDWLRGQSDEEQGSEVV
ncbi:short chain dehydrogenase/reductase [Trichosporon asahii var. asahii CBS 2479]|nr:short chain dehydrogenase/reductase [Trichosporon asahii var. asahii CBS 2479]EJT51955.1 short chain dehydrogenase/reductase [Trichosporon asahii var. asahii CBS 2479]